MRTEKQATSTNQSEKKTARRSYRKPQLNKLGSVAGLTQVSYVGIAKTDIGIYS